MIISFSKKCLDTVEYLYTEYTYWVTNSGRWPGKRLLCHLRVRESTSDGDADVLASPGHWGCVRTVQSHIWSGQCFQICIISMLLILKSRALGIYSHPDLEPGELENFTLDKSFPQFPHWKGVAGVPVLLGFWYHPHIYCSVLSLRLQGKHSNLTMQVRKWWLWEVKWLALPRS